MNREELLKSVFSQFDKSAKALCEKTNGIFCEISSEYKGKEKPQNLKKRFAKIYYNTFAVKFVYITSGMLGTVKHILSCYVMLDKTEKAAEIPLAMFSDYCDKDIIKPLSISLISNEIAMKQAFSCIGSELEGMLGLIADISCDDEKKTKISNTYINEVKLIFNVKSDEEYELYKEPEFFILRFASSHYINYLKGDYKTAAKQLGKIKDPTGYEKRMARLFSGTEASVNDDLSELVANAEFYNRSGVEKASGKEFFGMLLSWLIMAPFLSAIFLGLFWLIAFIDGIDSVCVLGPMYNFPITFLFGFITAIASSYFLRFRIYKIVNRRKYEKIEELDHIQNGEKSDKFMKGFLIVVINVSVIGTILLACWNLNFSEDGFTDNSNFFSINGEYHSYEEIDYVFYRPDRINGFGDKIEFDSYVILLEDGTEIDLYDFGETEDYKDELLKLLTDKGVTIKK